MKKLLLALLCLGMIVPMALADTLPIYHKPDKSTSAPYEKVQELAEAPFAADAETMRVDYVGIRQGDCIVIRVGGKTMLIDGGEGWRLPYVESYLKDNNIDHFDVMFLTHAHDDHIEIQEKLIKAGYSVDKVISPYSDKDNYSLWNGYKKLLKQEGIPYETYGHGDSMEFGGAMLYFFRNDNPKASMNNHTLVAVLQYGDAKVMLMGDGEGQTQHYLVKNVDAEMLKCDVYKAAHHGRTAVVADFLEAVDPGLTIVTNTKSSTAPHDAQLDRRNVPRYYISTGTICTETDGTQWYVWQEPLK